MRPQAEDDVTNPENEGMIRAMLTTKSTKKLTFIDFINFFIGLFNPFLWFI